MRGISGDRRAADHRKLPQNARMAIGGLLGAVLIGFAIGPSALASAPTIEPIGDGYFCRFGDNSATSCAGVSPNRGNLRVQLYRLKARGGVPRRVQAIRYRACSIAPSGNSRCVPRRTHSRGAFSSGDHGITLDRFRFVSAFPHREPGVYKLYFVRDGKQWGQIVRLRLTLGS